MNSNENKTEKKLKEIGWKISKVRQNMDLTQEEFADKFGYARTTLAKLEAGLRDIKSTEIVELAEKLGVSCDYLLGRTMAAAPDNLVQEMVDRYGLNEDTLKTLKRLKESRKNKEDFIYGNMPPSEDYEKIYSTRTTKEHIEHDERILEMLNLLFSTRRAISNHSRETHGEYILHTLYEYFFCETRDDLDRSYKVACMHADIIAFGQTLKKGDEK